MHSRPAPARGSGEHTDPPQPAPYGFRIVYNLEMNPKNNKKRYPTERTYTVTLVGGTKHALIGTHLERTAEYTIIWNEQIPVRNYQRSEFEDIR
jgi:hypothetical protein